MNAMVGKYGLIPDRAVKSGFRIDPHDRVTIEGKPFKLLGQSGENVMLAPADGDGVAEQFPMSVLARLSAGGHIKHEVGYYLPDDLKPAQEVKSFDFQLSALPKAAQKRFITRYGQIKAIEELVHEGLIRPCTADIEAWRDEIARRAKPYVKDVVTERDLLDFEAREERLPTRTQAKVRKRRGGKEKRDFEQYSPDYLRKLYAGYIKHGIAALAYNLSKSGYHSSHYRPEEQALLLETVQGSYLTPERKTIKATVVDVQRAFEKENARREVDGLSPLRVPGQDAVRGTIKRLGRLKVMIARYGREQAMKKLRPVGKGLEISRPGERVEIDEWCIDLLSIIHSAKLHAFFGTDFLEAAGLDEDLGRWWLVAAIDCRTKIILGMKLTRNPCASAARECLRMVVSDKGRWSDDANALTPWGQAVVPETLVSDNGPAFKASAFTNSCLDLRIALLRTIAGIPGMRGGIERLFHTMALDLMPRLKGRTFSNPLERGDYTAEDRACLDAEDVAFVLVRWAVDIYHNSPHEGLGGLTPLQQWDADMEAGNYPIRALPDTREKRIAFGKHLTRKVSREGVVIMGVRYHSLDLASYFVDGATREVEIRWDPEDIGCIDVFLEGQWIEVKSVHDRFSGVNFHVWLKARRSLRAKSASRKKWEEEVVFKAIDDIENLVAERSGALGIIDTTISDKRFKVIEQELFASFEMTAADRLQVGGDEPGREILPRAPENDPARNMPKAATSKAHHTQPANVEAEQSTPADAPRHSSASKTKPKSRTAWLPRKPEENK